MLSTHAYAHGSSRFKTKTEQNEVGLGDVNVRGRGASILAVQGSMFRTPMCNTWWRMELKNFRGWGIVLLYAHVMVLQFGGAFAYYVAGSTL